MSFSFVINLKRKVRPKESFHGGTQVRGIWPVNNIGQTEIKNCTNQHAYGKYADDIKILE